VLAAVRAAFRVLRRERRERQRAHQRHRRRARVLRLAAERPVVAFESAAVAPGVALMVSPPVVPMVAVPV